jgi:hypothetical protein
MDRRNRHGLSWSMQAAIDIPIISAITVVVSVFLLGYMSSRDRNGLPWDTRSVTDDILVVGSIMVLPVIRNPLVPARCLPCGYFSAGSGSHYCRLHYGDIFCRSHCPKCGSEEIDRVRGTGIRDHVAALVGWRVYLCRERRCEFYVIGPRNYDRAKHSW